METLTSQRVGTWARRSADGGPDQVPFLTGLLDGHASATV